MRIIVVLLFLLISSNGLSEKCDNYPLENTLGACLYVDDIYEDLSLKEASIVDVYRGRPTRRYLSSRGISSRRIGRAYRSHGRTRGRGRSTVRRKLRHTTTRGVRGFCTPSENIRHYTNYYGYTVQSPTYYTSRPAGATARCRDGSYSFSLNRRGTCSGHGGVAEWF